jgi:glycosyltransferase involved in cell wall biosynthesis
VKFSIITPSFRNSNWLKLCIASVADQGVELEHIVQDAGSDDGTLDWLSQDTRVKVFVEKDAGMYDGINRGLRRASGEILAYLNCDEQYLPGALQKVDEFFQLHPEMDVVFADAVVIDDQGNYLCSRQVQLPLKYHTAVVHLATLTCATFFRRNLLDQHGLFFDARYKCVGDAEWILRLLEKKIDMGILRYFTSAYTQTGANLSLDAKFKQEKINFEKAAPTWALKFRFLFILQHRLRRFIGGMYFQKPFNYALYTSKNPSQRVEHKITHPSFRWKEVSDDKQTPARC